MAKKRKTTDLISTESAKANDDSFLDKNDVQDIVENMIKCSSSKAKKRTKYYLYRFFGFDPRQASRLSNYSIHWGYKLDQKYKKNTKIQAHVQQEISKLLERFPGQYKALCQLRLTELADIEGLALEEYRRDPKMLINKPQLAKHLKQAAGVLGDDSIVSHQTISISDNRTLLYNNFNESRELELDREQLLEGRKVIEITEKPNRLAMKHRGITPENNRSWAVKLKYTCRDSEAETED